MRMKMRKFLDVEKFEHGCPWKNFKSSCRLMIFLNENASKAVVVMQETGDGTSVTNGAEQIATAALKIYELNPANTIFIEHYPEDQTGGEETFARVFFETMEKPQPFSGKNDGEVILISPAWTHLTKEEANELCGGLL